MAGPASSRARNPSRQPRQQPSHQPKNPIVDQTKTDQEHCDQWLNESLFSIENGQLSGDHPMTCAVGVREYLEITNIRHGDNQHQLGNGSIDCALAVWMNMGVRDNSDVGVLSVSQGNQLYRLGSGTIEGLENATAFRARMKRFIIVPVSNAILLPEQGQEEGAASHWGLLVIDTKKRKSRWFDGSLRLEPSVSHPGKRRITRMLDTGRVAGKILGGLEEVLGPERGRFEAKTAKYVPHQKHNNQCKADPAPSGPYVVAFVKYLYENPSYFEALRRSFKIGDWDKNQKDMEFDSLRTRIEMQELFRHEHEKSQSVGEFPLKITPEVFRILGPKILGPLLATAYRGFDGRQDVVDFDTFRWNGDEDYPPGEGSQSDEGDPPGERSQGDKGNKPSENPPPPRDDDKEMYDTDEEDDDDDDFTYYPNDPESVISKAVLRNEIRENTQLYSGIRTKQEYYRRAYENVRGIERTVRETPPIVQETPPIVQETQPIVQETQPIVQETQPIVQESPPPEEESPPQRKYKSKLKLPPGISALPSDFGNEQVVSNTELDAWRNANTELLKSLGLDDRARKANHTSFRAGLHALSGVTFPDEKAGRLVDIWLNDDEVFNTSDRRRLRRESSGVIAQRMKDKYEVFDRELLSQRRSSSRRSRSTPVVSPGGAKSRGVNLGATTASNIERPKVRLPARTRVVQYPKGSNKDNVPDFARIAITGSNFINFQRLNLDLFPNNDPGAVGEMTRRAILHRTYHGSFKGVSVRSLTDWKNDPRAFTPQEIKDKIRIKLPKEVAEQRMDTIYYNLDPPLFSSLSDSELERWTENLPPEVIEGLTPANVRGRLHRLFVGEFEELRTAQAEQNEKNIELLADWRKALGQDSGSADEVVDALISMYGPPPDEPFLAVSPIHWPSPEYLLSRQQGTKRKASTAPTQAKKRAKGK